MNVLIVESETELGALWKSHLERSGMSVTHVMGQEAAIDYLTDHDTDIIILDLVLTQGSSLTISDFASFRRPKAQIVFVTNTTFFSDGSIFSHAQNACAYLQSNTPPEDLAAMVEHYAGHTRTTPLESVKITS